MPQQTGHVVIFSKYKNYNITTGVVHELLLIKAKKNEFVIVQNNFLPIVPVKNYRK